MDAFTSLAIALLAGCAASDTRRFPLRTPLTRDTDLDAVFVQCRNAPDKKDKRHVACAPLPYESPFYWDGADNSIFRPLSQTLRPEAKRESVNVNSVDEVPDSAWFQNRIGIRPVEADEIEMAGCSPAQLLEPEVAEDGSWLIDKGRGNGSTPGFRIRVPGKGKYYVKLERAADEPERQSAASVIAASVFHIVGYNAPCEQVLYVRPSIFRLQPGLTYGTYFTNPKPYDQAAFAEDLALATKRDGLIRISASAWIAGHILGPWRYVGTRDDDPNDVVPHEDRRELRGMRVLAAWLGRQDAREANTLDTWIAEPNRPADGSPGRIIHYQLDVGETLGAKWGWDIDRRMGKAYMIDWSTTATDLVTFGVVRRPWDTSRITPGHELFGYFNVRDFDPESWKSEYPNPAFSRMTERDAAWMTRILARFTPEHIATLARMGNFTDPEQTEYLATVLQGRLDKILARYLTRLSPIDNLRVEDAGRLCGVDLARWRRVRDPASFRYRAWIAGGHALNITQGPDGDLCVALAHVAPDGGPSDDASSRYVRVNITNGIAPGPLVAHLYDLGPARGFVLVGIERPER